MALLSLVKNYLQGVGDPGTRLMFKFRSGTNGLNEELGRQRGTNDDRQCKLCGEECESVVVNKFEKEGRENYICIGAQNRSG